MNSCATSAGRFCTSGDFDEGPDHPSGLEIFEGLIDVLQREPLGDHALEVETAGPPQPDHAVEVDPHIGRSVQRAHQLLLRVEELEGVELDHLVHAADADHADRPAPPYRVVGGPNRDLKSDGLEAVIEPVATTDVAGNVGDLVGSDRMSGAEPAGFLPLRLHQVDGDDLGRAGEPGALDDADADAAATEHDHRRTGLHPGRIA